MAPHLFKYAIVRTPARSIVDALTTAGLGAPDYRLARRQHDGYVDALERCGLAVTALPAEQDQPDSVFVEDVAVLAGSCAVLTRPGATPRRAEVPSVEVALRRLFPVVEGIEAPGTLDGGDVLELDGRFHIGLSARTDDAGARKLGDILRRHGHDVSTISIDAALHLKSCVNHLADGVVLAASAFHGHPALCDCTVIEVEPEEAYAANSLWLNGTVLVPAGYPGTRAQIEAAGFSTIELDVSEFRKADGGLSCLSLRFGQPV